MLIKEKVKPIQPFTVGNNNIHGHVCIDLHNTKSGSTERIEGDNLVTNAAQDILNLAAIGYNVPPYNLFPIATNLLGGLFIFDGTLAENVNNVNFPGSEAHFIGCAGDRVDTSLSYLGVRNNEESKPIQDGYTTVWDFSTNQVNGTIKSLARTKVECGNYIYYALQLLSRNVVNIIGSKVINHYFYNNKLYWNNKIYYNSLQGKRLGLDVLESTGEVYSNNFGPLEKTYYTQNVGENLIYISNSSKDLICYNIATDTISNITTFPTSQNKNITKTENFIYAMNIYNPTPIYKVDLVNPSNIQTIEGYSNIIKAGKSAVILQNGSTGTILYDDGIEVPVTLSNDTTFNNSIYFQDKPFIVRVSSDYSNLDLIAFLRPFLGTIFNLPAPITKTANQTMKITYTLINV